MKQSKRAWKKRNKFQSAVTSSPSIDRGKRLRASKRKAERLPPKTLDVAPVQDGFGAQLFFNIHDMSYGDASRSSRQLLDSIKQLTTGQYKIVKHRYCSYRKDRLIKSVFLENSSDVLILMMCHRELVKKIHYFDENKAPNGALCLSSSCFDDGSSFPEMLTCIA